MNYVAASLLYHSEEWMAFWIMVAIFEKFEMRDIYLPTLPGLSKHCQILDYLILEHLPKIHSQLIENQVDVQLFSSAWIISFFGSILPIDMMGLFFDKMLDQGWPFFYRFVLAILIFFQHQILTGDQVSILSILCKNSFLRESKTINWFEIIDIAQNLELDDHFINDMLVRFDEEKKQFRILY